MKASLPGTDLEVEFYILNGDHRCEELLQLGRPTSNNDENVIKECNIVLEEGDHVQIVGFVSGTIYQARIDLLVDGAFVGDRSIDAPKPGSEPKLHTRRRIEFKTVTSVESSGEEHEIARMIDGQMFVSPTLVDVDPAVLIGTGETFGVGSIVLVISIEQELSPGYTPTAEEYPDCMIGAWRGRECNVRDSSTLPTHSIELRNTGEIIRQRASQIQRHFRGPRPGYGPFAKLIFHYRSHEAMLKASVVAAPSRSYPLGPHCIELPLISSPPRRTALDAQRAISSPTIATACFKPRKAHRSTCTSILTWDCLVLRYAGFLAAKHATRISSWSDQYVKEEPKEDQVIIEVLGHDYELPPANTICNMIPKNGIAIRQVLRVLMPALPKEHRSTAAKLFLLYMQQHAALRYDQRHKQLVVKRCDLADLQRQSVLVQEFLLRQH